MRESQVSVLILADSLGPQGQRVTTFEIEYPRFILAEINTHRMFSRNSASSRAIPISKMLEQVKNDPAMPMHWGINQSGMQAKETLSGWKKTTAIYLWKAAAKTAVGAASSLQEFGLHKQIVNRLLEPFQRMKTVVTSTEWENFFYLRDHPDAQPEFMELAALMRKAMGESTPQKLKAGEWHLPYIDLVRRDSGELEYQSNGQTLTLDEARKLSCSLCAQVSYRLLDTSVEKATKIYDQLVTMTPVHSSPLEHQATPMKRPVQQNGYSGQEGVTHIDMFNNFWSGNLKGFVQYRHLIKGNTRYGDSRDS